MALAGSGDALSVGGCAASARYSDCQQWRPSSAESLTAAYAAFQSGLIQVHHDNESAGGGGVLIAASAVRPQQRPVTSGTAASQKFTRPMTAARAMGLPVTALVNDSPGPTGAWSTNGLTSHSSSNSRPATAWAGSGWPARSSGADDGSLVKQPNPAAGKMLGTADRVSWATASSAEAAAAGESDAGQSYMICTAHSWDETVCIEDHSSGVSALFLLKKRRNHEHVVDGSRLLTCLQRLHLPRRRHAYCGA